MAKKRKQPGQGAMQRSARVKLSAEESLRRMKDFPKRKDAFIAKGKDRGVSA